MAHENDWSAESSNRWTQAGSNELASSHIFLLNGRCIQIWEFMLMNTFFILAVFWLRAYTKGEHICIGSGKKKLSNNKTVWHDVMDEIAREKLKKSCKVGHVLTLDSESDKCFHNITFPPWSLTPLPSLCHDNGYCQSDDIFSQMNSGRKTFFCSTHKNR